MRWDFKRILLIRLFFPYHDFLWNWWLRLHCSYSVNRKYSVVGTFLTVQCCWEVGMWMRSLNLGVGLGQSIENKGREYGAYIRAGDFRWWVRETGIEPTMFAHALLLIKLIYMQQLWPGFSPQNFPELSVLCAKAESTNAKWYFCVLNIEYRFIMCSGMRCREIQHKERDGGLPARCTYPVLQLQRCHGSGQISCLDPSCGIGCLAWISENLHVC